MDLKTAIAMGDSGVVSLVGAGGKTSLMYALAKELVAIEKRVLTTTTTKIFMPNVEESPVSIVSGVPGDIVVKAQSLLQDHLHLTVGCDYLPEQGKLTGLNPEALLCILQAKLFDFIIIEADGAAGRSLKACAPHEPVVPQFSDIIVSLVGLDVLGRPLDEKWVFRSELFSNITGLPLMHPVTESAISSILLHDAASIRSTIKATRKVVFFNKADSTRACISGEQVATLLEKEKKGLFERCVIGELRPEPKIHRCLINGKSRTL